jgi:hypothetical protein
MGLYTSQTGERKTPGLITDHRFILLSGFTIHEFTLILLNAAEQRPPAYFYSGPIKE